MMELKLEPNISSCIRTVAKREYERVLRVLLTEDQEDKAVEDALELLRLFLESADFRRLRALSEKLLLEGGRVEFILRSTDRAPGYEIEINQL